jgi:hypothetical protein
MNYSVHKKNPDIVFMCHLHITVKLYSAACSLFDADSHFFPKQKNLCSCSLLNVRTTAQECIGRNVSLSRKNEVGYLRQFGLNLISNYVCSLV